MQGCDDAVDRIRNLAHFLGCPTDDRATSWEQVPECFDTWSASSDIADVIGETESSSTEAAMLLATEACAMRLRRSS
ncbi:MAG: hypothetical protein MZW92_08260 [Comamonadaceae bacterium]|nr:hypothetical protein [Comamonadaceae bacterium]